jgi:hypothetical protein
MQRHRKCILVSDLNQRWSKTCLQGSPCGCLSKLAPPTWSPGFALTQSRRGPALWLLACFLNSSICGFMGCRPFPLGSPPAWAPSPSPCMEAPLPHFVLHCCISHRHPDPLPPFYSFPMTVFRSRSPHCFGTLLPTDAPPPPLAPGIQLGSANGMLADQRVGGEDVVFMTFSWS